MKKSSREFTAGVMSKASGDAKSVALMMLVGALGLGTAAAPFINSPMESKVPSWQDEEALRAEAAELKRRLVARRRYGKWL